MRLAGNFDHFRLAVASANCRGNNTPIALGAFFFGTRLVNSHCIGWSLAARHPDRATSKLVGTTAVRCRFRGAASAEPITTSAVGIDSELALRTRAGTTSEETCDAVVAL